MKTAEQWYLSETMLFALKWTPERVMETVSAIQTDARVDLERELASVTKELQSLKDTHGTLLTALEYNRNERDSLQSALRACAEALNKLWEDDEMGFIVSEEYDECIKCGAHALTAEKIEHCPGCVQGYIYTTFSVPAVQAVLKQSKPA